MESILLIEDSHSLAALFRSRIQGALGVEVRLADSYAAARREVTAAGADLFLAIFNLNLPDAPNGEIVDYILQCGIPGFVLTGTYNRELQAEILGRGVLDYFVKDNIGVIDSVIHAVDRIRKNKHLNILAVDDSRGVRALLGGFLRRYGFNVLEAADGREGLALATQQPVQLVIADYQMPEMDGVQLIKKLRSRHSRDEMAIIGLSSVEEHSLAVQFIKAGANDFLVKPFQFEELLCRVYQNIEIIERRRELQHLLERHRSALTNALDAIITTDSLGCVLDFNPAAEVLFGYSRAEMLGKPVVDYIVPPELRAKHQQALAQRADPARAGEPLKRRFEVPGLRSDGKVVDLQIGMTAITQQESIHFTAFIQDITDRKQLLKSLEETLAAAEQANRTKSDFIANMSHEIRTPMNAVLGFTDLGLKSDISPRVRDYLDKIKNASHSLMGIINDILDFSKMEVARLELDPVKFDLHHLFERLGDLFSKQVADKEIELVLVAPSAFDAVLHGDVNRLEQVLINLIRNAIKFTERGAVVVDVQPQALADGQIKLAFAVRDTGIGIDPAILPKLFDPFVQADSSTTRKYGGTGLGLSICRRLVGLMGGEIGADSTPGVGSRFWFDVLVTHYADNQRQRIGLPAAWQGASVVLVDDEPAARAQLAGWLQELGLQPSVFDSGLAAVAALPGRSLRQNPCAVVLADWRMPGKDGLATLVELRAAWAAHDPGAPMPRLVLLTPFGVEEIRREGELAHLDGFLDKPCTRARLVQTLLGTAPLTSPELDRRCDKTLGQERETSERVAGARVLLVEDNPLNQQVALELLRQVGLVVEVAGNGRQAVALAARYPYELVLMDIQMPELDGHRAAQAIRAQLAGRTLPIIAMTAHAAADELKRIQDDGMEGHLDKPIRPERLYGLLNRWIGERPLAEGMTLEEMLASAAVSGLDVEAGLARVGHNRPLYHRLLTRFWCDHDGAADALDQAWAAGELGAVVQRARVVGGLADLIGAIPLARAAQGLAAALAEEDPASHQAARALFGTHLEELLTGLAGPHHLRPRGEREAVRPLLGESVDTRQLAPLLLDLAARLHYHGAELEPRLETLGQLLSAGEPLAIWRELRKQVRDFHFDEALQVVRRIADALGLTWPVDFAWPPGDSRQRILIVDDQPGNVSLLLEILGEFQLQVAMTGQQALRLARMVPAPDLILLDVMLPVMNGYEVCRRLKEEARTQHIPVIFVTARKEVADETEGFRVGGVDFITKPFSPEIVKRRVQIHLELKRRHDWMEEQIQARTEELEAARSEAERRKEAAEAGNQAKSRFLASMSHEIRTPMNAILGMAEALEETGLSHDQQQYVTVFRRAGVNLLGMINDLLDLSKVEEGRMELLHESFALGELLNVTLKIVQVRAVQKGLGLALVLEAGLPEWVMGDPGRLQQVVINLLDNAIKFTLRGHVTLSVRADDGLADGVRIEVADTGIGIAPDKCLVIFDSFIQADSSITRRYGGSGLGLAICRQLVTLMGGVIGVESEEGRGSRFHLTVPLPSARLKSEQATDPAAARKGHHKGGHGLEILLVEDAEDNILLIQVFLKQSGHRLTVARNGQEGLELFCQRHFGLVLMDVQMPVMDGYTATRAMRHHEQQTQRKRTPIFALTAHAFADDARLAAEAGCDQFLTKPIGKKKLLAAIEGVL